MSSLTTSQWATSPERGIAHKIELEQGAKPSFSPFSRLSQEEGDILSAAT